MALREETLRRILVSKHFLASSTGQLTPNSDAIATAKMIVTSHDAAELAAAAIADEVGATNLPTRPTLMDYPAAIDARRPHAEGFPGRTFLDQLNRARVDFKHGGILPDTRSWFQVIERTWDWVDAWCEKYLEVSLNEIDLAQLLADTNIREWFSVAKQEYANANYQIALEWLGYAFYAALEQVPGISVPTTAKRNTDQALLVSAYGVRPSDFLALQEFLPHVQENKDKRLTTDWNLRETGNPANWNEVSVRFCLDTFLDIALKIQHAPWTPSPVSFYSVFDDVIIAKHDGVELYRYEYEGQWPVFGRKTGRTVIRTLAKGEAIRGHVFPVKPERDPTQYGLLYFVEPTIESAEELHVNDHDLDVHATVLRADVEITYAPRSRDWIKSRFPHLF